MVAASEWWYATEDFEESHSQHRDDTEWTQRYNNGESAGTFHLMLDSGHSWNVAARFSDMLSLFVGHYEDVGVRE